VIEWLIALAVLIAALIVVAVSLVRARRNDSSMLKQRFGPEYERAQQMYGTKADRELQHRLRRAEKLRIVPLSKTERTRFAAFWEQVQAHFVDNPEEGVRQADRLIVEVMRARGYPIDRFEQRVADLSVDHAEVIQHYRAARTLAEMAARGDASTEDMRQAMLHYRLLFADLLEPDAEVSTRMHTSEAMT
jgi:hypothetical protein